MTWGYKERSPIAKMDFPFLINMKYAYKQTIKLGSI